MGRKRTMFDLVDIVDNEIVGTMSLDEIHELKNWSKNTLYKYADTDYIFGERYMVLRSNDYEKKNIENIPPKLWKRWDEVRIKTGEVLAKTDQRRRAEVMRELRREWREDGKKKKNN